MSNPLSHPVPRPSLTLQDGRWVKEETMQQVSAAHPSPALGFDDFQLRVLPSPRSSGQIAMDSWCHQRTMLKLRACASAVPEFERSQIASLSSFSAEVATAFIDAFLALQLCLTSRISSQQFNAHTFLEQGTSFQVKRGMQRVQDQ